MGGAGTDGAGRTFEGITLGSGFDERPKMRRNNPGRDPSCELGRILRTGAGSAAGCGWELSGRRRSSRPKPRFGLLAVTVVGVVSAFGAGGGVRDLVVDRGL